MPRDGKGTYFGVAPTGRPLRLRYFSGARQTDCRTLGHGDIAGVLAQLRGWYM